MKTSNDSLEALLVAEPCLTEEEARRELGLPPPRDREDEERKPEFRRRRFSPSAS